MEQKTPFAVATYFLRYQCLRYFRGTLFAIPIIIVCLLSAVGGDYLQAHHLVSDDAFPLVVLSPPLILLGIAIYVMIRRPKHHAPLKKWSEMAEKIPARGKIPE